MNFFDTWPTWAWITTIGGALGLGVFIWAAPALAGKLVASALTFIGEIIKTPIGAAIVFGALAFGAGWFIQGLRLEALCNQRIEDVKQAGIDAGKKRDAENAKAAAHRDTTAQGWINSASVKRKEIAHEKPNPSADCRKLGDFGVNWLRRISPD